MNTVPGACCHISQAAGQSQSFRFPTFDCPSLSIPPCGTAVNNLRFRLQGNTTPALVAHRTVERHRQLNCGYCCTRCIRSVEPAQTKEQGQERHPDHSDGGMGTPDGSRPGSKELLFLLGKAAENNHSGEVILARRDFAVRFVYTGSRLASLYIHRGEQPPVSCTPKKNIASNRAGSRYVRKTGQKNVSLRRAAKTRRLYSTDRGPPIFEKLKSGG